MFIRAVFIIAKLWEVAKLWEEPKCLATDNGYTEGGLTVQ